MIAAVLAVALLVVCGVLWWQSEPGLLADRVHKQVIVTLKSGSAFQGLLAAVDSEAVVLVSAAYVKSAEEPVPVDGEVIVLRADIDFMQRP